MRQHGFEHAFAELVEAAALQTEIAYHRLALEWGQMVFSSPTRSSSGMTLRPTRPWPMRTRSQHRYRCWTRRQVLCGAFIKCWPIPAACFNSIGGFYSIKCRPPTSPDGKTRSPSSSTAHGEGAARGSAWHGRCSSALSRAA
jgi:hypothetical protein